MRWLALLVAVGALAACTSSTPIGIGQIPADKARTAKISEPPVRDYTLAPGDVIEFRVIGTADDLETVQTVRADGRISLPYIDDQVVSGLTLQELRSRLWKEYVYRGILKSRAH